MTFPLSFSACYVDLELRIINITGTTDLSFKLEALNTESALR